MDDEAQLVHDVDLCDRILFRLKERSAGGVPGLDGALAAVLEARGVAVERLEKYRGSRSQQPTAEAV